jgi:hypothetical protein
MAVWLHEINVSAFFEAHLEDEDFDFVASRDGIVATFRAAMKTNAALDEMFAELIDELADSSDTDDFDVVWQEVYNVADFERVWIKTIV